MSHSWKTDETPQKLGSKTVLGEDGSKKIKSITKKVTFEYPAVEADTPEAFAAEIGPLMQKGVFGFRTWPQVQAHLNYGLRRSIAVAYNSGQDATLTPNQRSMVKMYAGIVRLGGMPQADAVAYLTGQGVENALAVLEAFDPSQDE